MSTREFFAQRLAAELPAFVKVIRAMPQERLDYRPHEKNTSAGVLAWQLATEMGGIVELLDSGVIDYTITQPPAVEEIASAFERHANASIERAKSLSEERWTGPGKFKWGGQVVWESTVDDIAWGFLFDMIHHRGQLSAYLRPMGGKVPAIYGPSGDDQG